MNRQNVNIRNTMGCLFGIPFDKNKSNKKE